MEKIEFKQVSYSYPLSPRPVLNDMTFKVEQGEFVGVVGRNGVGKTTICHGIRGFIPHFFKGDLTGDIQVGNLVMNDLSNISDVSTLIGYVFQNPFTQMSGIEETVFNEIAFGLENIGLSKEIILTRVNKVLEELQIEHLKYDHPLYLSGGQQQKVSLASVIAMEPPIIIADEPTSQLDPQATEEIFSLLKKHHSQGKTIFLVEHKIDLLYEYATRILVVDDGKIVIDDTPEKAFLSEELSEYGVEIPKILELGKLLQQKYSLQEIPKTKEEIKEILLFYNRERQVGS